MKVFLAKIWVADAPYTPTLSNEGVFRTQAAAAAWMTANGLYPTPETPRLWDHPTDDDIYGIVSEHDVC